MLDLGFTIGNKTIIDGLNVEFGLNSFFALIGANGSGKSTLLKLINKNITHYTGKITLDDKDIKNITSKELATKRSVLHQSMDFSLSLSAKEFLYLPLDLHLSSKQEKKRLSDELIQRLDLGSFIDQNYQTLSGGQRQRVQFARVLAQLFIGDMSEKFLFLDEPTLNLDIAAQYLILDLVKDMIREFKIGVFAILHDLHQAFLYADLVGCMQDGKLTVLPTKQALSEKRIEDVFGVRSQIVQCDTLNQQALVTAAKKQNIL